MNERSAKRYLYEVRATSEPSHAAGYLVARTKKDAVRVVVGTLCDHVGDIHSIRRVPYDEVLRLSSTEYPEEATPTTARELVKNNPDGIWIGAWFL